MDGEAREAFEQAATEALRLQIQKHCAVDGDLHFSNFGSCQPRMRLNMTKPWFMTKKGGTPPRVISTDTFYGTLPIQQP